MQPVTAVPLKISLSTYSSVSIHYIKNKARTLGVVIAKYIFMQMLHFVMQGQMHRETIPMESNYSSGNMKKYTDEMTYLSHL